MRLDVTGHPLHTRSLSVVFAAREDGRLDGYGTVIDLRKRGFVPVAGDLQAAGLIHDMRLAALVDPTTRLLERIDAEQRSVAFEASATTEGESCRDPIGRVAALAGSRLDAGWARRVSAEIGGPRGCSHLMTLAHLLGTTTGWMLDREHAIHGGVAARRPGERLFRRDLVLDGVQPAEGRLALTAQLGDLYLAPAPALAPPISRFGGALDIRLVAEVEWPTCVLLRIAAADRHRGPDELGKDAWRDRDEVVAPLVGQRLGAGFAALLIERLGAVPDDRPLLDVLLNLAPAVIQCMAAMIEPWHLATRTSPSIVGMGGLPDSCFMWRRDGALSRARERDQGAGSK